MKKLILLLLGLGLLATRDEAGGKMPKPRFPLGKETTYVTEPLDADGYIDYVTALNERLRRGVTPDNNANVLIWQALGPHPEKTTMPAEFFKWMGIKAPPEKGEYFIELAHFLRQHPKLGPVPDAAAINKELELCSQRPWKAAAHPKVAAWLKANEKPLALVAEAAKRTHYYSPLVPKRTKNGRLPLIAMLFSGPQKCRVFGIALTSRAMLRIGENGFEGAWQDLLACHRISRLVARGATVIELLAGIAIDRVACKAELAFLDHFDWKADRINKSLCDLRNLQSMPTIADKVDLSDRIIFLEMVAKFHRFGPEFLEKLSGDPPEKVSDEWAISRNNIDWEAVLRIINRWYDRIAKSMRVNIRETREKQLKQIIIELKELKKKTQNSSPEIKEHCSAENSAKIRGEWVGNVLISLMLPAFNKVQSAAERCEQTQNNLYLAFALAAYHRDHGRYPQQLDELAPKYLDKIPTDLFSAQPLIYRPSAKGYVLYSVGVNGRDEQGRGNEADPSGDDLAVQMPLPKLPRK